MTLQLEPNHLRSTPICSSQNFTNSSQEYPKTPKNPNHLLPIHEGDENDGVTLFFGTLLLAQKEEKHDEDTVSIAREESDKLGPKSEVC